MIPASSGQLLQYWPKTRKSGFLWVPFAAEELTTNAETFGWRATEGAIGKSAEGDVLQSAVEPLGSMIRCVWMDSMEIWSCGVDRRRRCEVSVESGRMTAWTN